MQKNRSMAWYGLSRNPRLIPTAGRWGGYGQYLWVLLTLVLLASGSIIVAGPISGSGGATSSALSTAQVPTIVLTPTQGPSGSNVSVVGSGFTPGVTIATTISTGASNTACSPIVAGDGTFSCLFNITGTPSTTPYTVNATGSDGSPDFATASFTITTPSVELSSSQGPAALNVSVNASGLSPNLAYDIYFDATAGTALNLFTTCTTDLAGNLTGSTGDAVCQAAVPTVAAGTYTVDFFEDVSGNYIASASTQTFQVTTPAILLSPTQGPSGVSVGVTGTGFTPSATITTSISTGGTISACSPTVATDGSFSCSVTISGTAAAYTVTSTGSDGSYDSATASFTITGPAVGLSYSQGPAGLEVSVAASGLAPSTAYDLDFDATPGTSQYLFTTCTTDLAGDLTGSTGDAVCQAAVPTVAAGTYTVDFFEDVSGNYIASASTQTFQVTTPAILLSPTQGPSGVSVGVTGTGFTPSATITTSISTGGTISACSPTVATDGSFSCSVTISGTAAAYTVTSTGSDGSYDSATASFTITTPMISLTPTQGPSGVSVTVTGTGFTPDATVTMAISGTAAIGTCPGTVSASGGFGCPVTITGPASGIAYTVTATGSDLGLDSATAPFTITTPLISLTPAQGPSGATTTVSGSGFTPGMSVTTSINGGALIGACGAPVAADGSFSCPVTISGTASVTAYAVSATGSDGHFDSASAPFTITSPGIVLSPTQGPTGVSVGVTGTGFTPSATITTSISTGGTISACSPTVASDGSFSCSVTISGTAAAYTVTSTGSDGSYDSATASFTITVPAITLNPTQAPSGASVTVSGTGFTPGVVVMTTINGGADIGSCGATVSATGDFSCPVLIHGAASSYTVTAAGADGGADVATASFTITTTGITLSPTEGPTGVSVIVSGTGFTPGMTIVTSITTGATIGACGATVSDTGSFTCPAATVDGTASASPYTVTATGSDGGLDNATATFTITTPTITLAPTQGPSGASSTLTGAGFTPGAVITTTIDGSGTSITSCGATVRLDGSFSCGVTITGPVSGTPYKVTATGSDGSFDKEQASFTITLPGITLSPTRGPSGASVTVTGSGFTPGVTITTAISLGENIGACGTTVSGAGSFTCPVTVTGTASASPYTVTATGSDGSFDSATALFTITVQKITLNPSQGPTGTSVSVSGSGFTPGVTITTTIEVGATISPCGVTVLSDGTFSCPVTIAGAVSATAYIVTATGSDGTFDSTTASFLITAPSITLGPAQGPSHESVTVSGTGFTPGQTVETTIGTGASIGTCGQTVSATGSFSCQVTITGTASETAYIVNATGSDGGSDFATASFTITTPIISLSPVQGPSGVSVTVTGTGFTPSVTVTASIGTGATITLCGKTVSLTGSFSCKVTVTGTASATAYTVTAQGSDGSYDSATASFTITSPSITLSPTQGPSGTQVTVTGSGFSPGVSVTFTISGSGVIETPTACTASGTGTFSGCTFNVVGSAASYAITATGSDGGYDAATATFVVTTASITLSPTQGPSGATVTVTGTGFTPGVVVTTTISGSASIGSCGQTVSATGGFSCSVTITGTASASPYTVTATGADGNFDSATALFTLTLASIVASPIQGPVGSNVTVSGTGFSVSTALESFSFGGQPVGSCVHGSLTTNSTGAFSCTFRVPSGTTSSTVIATDVGGQAARATFKVTVPEITVSPGQGPTGTLVTVRGTNFSVTQRIASLVFDSQTITNCAYGGSLVTGSSGTFSCEFEVPAGTSGTSVIATDEGGQSASASFAVTVPAISTQPSQGPVGGSFTVLGTGFSVSSGVNVSFGGTVLSPTSCSVGTITSGSIATNSSGAFSCTFKVPSVTASSYPLEGTDLATGMQSAPVSFAVTSPLIGSAPSQGPAGALVDVTGAGFSVSTPVASLVFGGQPITKCDLGSLVTNSTGAFSCMFAVPSHTSGSAVVATDVGGQTASLTFTVTTPAITLSVHQGPAGAPVTVDGSGFSLLAPLASLTFGGAAVSCVSGSLTTSSSGAFSCEVRVPLGTTAGATVTATDSGGASATASFVVTVPAIIVFPSNGAVGTPFTVNGSGFTVSSGVEVLFNGTAVAALACTVGTASGVTITSSSTGVFSCSFAVPSESAGSYTISATDSTTSTATGAVSFSVPPPPSSGASPFPWWIVGVIAAVVLALLVVVLLVYGRRRRRPSRPPVAAGLSPAPSRPAAPGALEPWNEGEVAPAAMVGEAPSLPSYAEAAPTPSVPGAAAPVPTSEPEPDIDELMARLERISMEIFKRTPKELSQLPSEEETTGTPDEK